MNELVTSPVHLSLSWEAVLRFSLHEMLNVNCHMCYRHVAYMPSHRFGYSCPVALCLPFAFAFSFHLSLFFVVSFCFLLFIRVRVSEDKILIKGTLTICVVMVMMKFQQNVEQPEKMCEFPL
jgi:hypothetical protein